MFERNGEKLGSVLGDGDGSYSNAPKEVAEKAPAKQAVSKPEPDPVATTPEAVDTPRVEDSPEAERPKVADNKAAWIAYAISQGMDRELAEDESTTKQDLIDSYGG